MTKIYYFTTSLCLVYKIKPKIAFGTSLFFHTCKIQLYIFRENGPLTSFLCSFRPVCNLLLVFLCSLEFSIIATSYFVYNNTLFTTGSLHFNLHNLLLLNMFEALKIMLNFTLGANFGLFSYLLNFITVRTIVWHQTYKQNGQLPIYSLS